nr:hypothetical protein [uncultured Microbacterium sp.]
MDATADLLAAAALAYLILLPVGHTPVLLAVLSALGLWCVWRLVRSPRRLSPLLLAAAGCAAAAMLIGGFAGIGNPGFGHSLISWVAAPLLFWVWASQIDVDVLALLLRAAAWATVVLAVAILSFWVVGAVGAEPSGWLRVVLDVDVSGRWPNVVVGVYGASSLISVAPLWIVALFFRGRAIPSRGLIAAAAILATLAAVVSTRRAALALELVVPAVLFLVYLLMVGRTWFTRRNIRALIAVAVAAVALGIAVLATPAGQRMSAGVIALVSGQGGTPDEDLRLEQVDRLWSAFLTSPLFGHGIGAVIPGYSRNEDRPWAFEMQYNLLLFQVGMVGALLLAVSATLVVCAAVRVMAHRPEARPAVFVTAAGASAALLANALNPILQAPGHFWAVFLVVGAVNAFGHGPDTAISASAAPESSGDDATARAD